MYKKFISSILVIALLNLLGCYSSDLVTVTEYNHIKEEDKPNNIIVKTKDSQVYHFSDSNFYIKNDTLHGKVSTREQSIGGMIAFREIASIQFEDFGSKDPSLITISQYQKIEAETGKPDEIYLTKIDSTRYHFMKNDYYTVNDTLFGRGKLLIDDREQLIPLSEIEVIQYEYVDDLKTTLLVFGIAALSLIVGYSIWFVTSWHL